MKDDSKIHAAFDTLKASGLNEGQKIISTGQTEGDLIEHLAVVEATLSPSVILKSHVSSIRWLIPLGQHFKGVRDSDEAMKRFTEEIEKAPKAGLYRHYKGGHYKVLGLALDRDNLFPYVIYESQAYGTKWLRPVADFIEQVRVPRFALLPG